MGVIMASACGQDCANISRCLSYADTAPCNHKWRKSTQNILNLRNPLQCFFLFPTGEKKKTAQPNTWFPPKYRTRLSKPDGKVLELLIFLSQSYLWLSETFKGKVGPIARNWGLSSSCIGGCSTLVITLVRSGCHSPSTSSHPERQRL